MPSSCCSVPGCSERGGHVFPKDTDLRRKWILAIKRLDERSLKPWLPTNHSVVCKRHFTPNDYIKETIYGRSPLAQRLLPSASPSIFPWSKNTSESAAGRTERASEREAKKRKWNEACLNEISTSRTTDGHEASTAVTRDSSDVTYMPHTILHEHNYALSIPQTGTSNTTGKHSICNSCDTINHDNVDSADGSCMHSHKSEPSEMDFLPLQSLDKHQDDNVLAFKPNSVSLSLKGHETRFIQRQDGTVIPYTYMPTGEKEEITVQQAIKQTMDSNKMCTVPKLDGIIINNHDNDDGYATQRYIALLTCKQCNMSFCSEERLKSHMSNHILELPTGSHIETPFKCEKCDIVFTSQLYLNNHISNHTTLISETCKTNLGLHLNRRWNCSETQLPSKVCIRCDICGLSLDEVNFDCHKLIHRSSREVKPFTCKICRSSFHLRSHFSNHMKFHTGHLTFRMAQYNCGECGESFLDKTALLAHIEARSVGKQYRCGVCGDSFSLLVSLVAHIQTHIQTRYSENRNLHVCEICNVVVAGDLDFDKHTRIHLGYTEDPLCCIVCYKQFALLDDLLDHLNAHTGERYVHCRMCSHVALTQTQLTRHMNKMHAAYLIKAFSI